jgi:hypothetical protein
MDMMSMCVAKGPRNSRERVIYLPLPPGFCHERNGIPGAKEWVLSLLRRVSEEQGQRKMPWIRVEMMRDNPEAIRVTAYYTREDEYMGGRRPACRSPLGPQRE